MSIRFKAWSTVWKNKHETETDRMVSSVYVLLTHIPRSFQFGHCGQGVSLSITHPCRMGFKDVAACFRELGILARAFSPSLLWWFGSSGASRVWLGNTHKIRHKCHEMGAVSYPSTMDDPRTRKIAMLFSYSCLLQACVLVTLPSKCNRVQEKSLQKASKGCHIQCMSVEACRSWKQQICAWRFEPTYWTHTWSANPSGTIIEVSEVWSTQIYFPFLRSHIFGAESVRINVESWPISICEVYGFWNLAILQATSPRTRPRHLKGLEVFVTSMVHVWVGWKL